MEQPSYHSDLGFVAALVTVGYTVVGELRRGQDGRMEFGFLMPEETMASLFIVFKAGDMKVDAQENALSLKKVKRMLKVEKENALAVA